MKKSEEFYVLIRGGMVCSVNWACWGKNGVYCEVGYLNKHKDDKIIKVREVNRKKSKKKK